MTSGRVILEENMRRLDLTYLYMGCILDIPNRATEYIVEYFSLEFNADFWASVIDVEQPRDWMILLTDWE